MALTESDLAAGFGVWLMVKTGLKLAHGAGRAGLTAGTSAISLRDVVGCSEAAQAPEGMSEGEAVVSAVLVSFPLCLSGPVQSVAVLIFVVESTRDRGMYFIVE